MGKEWIKLSKLWTNSIWAVNTATAENRSVVVTRMQVYNGFKTFLQMSYHHMSTHTLTCMHKDSHKHIHAHTNTNTHMHTNTQDVKGVHTSTALLYTHTHHYCRASDRVKCYCLPLQCYIIIYHNMYACLFVCCQWMLACLLASMVLKEN